MRLTIEDGLLMVFGPENDPVPPYAFAAAAAARPDARVGLPDGTTTAASRVATVLGAQILGRLGGPGGRRVDPRDAARRRWARGCIRGCAERRAGQRLGALAPDAGHWRPAASLKAAIRPYRANTNGLRPVKQTPCSRTSPDEDRGYHEALDQASLDRAARPSSWSPSAPPSLELDLEELVASTDACLDLDFSDERLPPTAWLSRTTCRRLRGAADLPHETAPPKADQPVSGDPEPGMPVSMLDALAASPDADRLVASRTRSGPGRSTRRPPRPGSLDVDPDSMVLVVIRGVPEGARLSTGVRDDDGSWSISPLDLSTVTITLAAPSALPGGRWRAGRGPGVDVDLSITGIAFTEDGELVAISERVPLADYLDDPARAMLASAIRVLASQAGARSDRRGRARTIALEANPRPGRRVDRARAGPAGLAGGAFDALVIRDLPAGARLSAGAYDPAIDGWVLRPQDLRGLAILPPPACAPTSRRPCLGIALRSGDANAARVLARLPVRLA